MEINLHFLTLYMLLLLSRSRRPIIYSNNGIMNWGHGVYALFVLLMINYLLLEIMHFGCHVYWWFLGSSWGFIWLGFHFITCTCCCVLNLTFENHFGYLYIYIYISLSNCSNHEFSSASLQECRSSNNPWFKNWIFERVGNDRTS